MCRHVHAALATNALSVMRSIGPHGSLQGNAKFLDAVVTWQRRLGLVESVLGLWGEAQSKWGNLESVFVGSADIRVQLPGDAKRFEAVDSDFQVGAIDFCNVRKQRLTLCFIVSSLVMCEMFLSVVETRCRVPQDMMRSVADTTNVVEACTAEGRQERLEHMLTQLETCEKALQEYLETKRLAFPRFYFVSPADLLDVLSKGTYPHAIMRCATAVVGSGKKKCCYFTTQSLHAIEPNLYRE